jgi:cytoskeleton protein RodZ
MSSLGSCLREKRIQRGLSVEEIARSTRVSSRYLIALESDDFSQLPSPVFTRGFIRAYCEILGEPVDEALALYEQRQGGEEPPGRPAPRAQPDTASTGTKARGRSAVFVSFILVVGLGAALFAVTVALQRGREPARDERTEAVRGAPDTSVSPSLPPAMTEGPARVPEAPASSLEVPRPSEPSPQPLISTSAEPPPSPAPPPPSALMASAVSPYRLVAKTRELTWLRVRTEDGHLTEENIPAGQVREWVSDRPFIITVGNAGGITFELNGRPLPPLGVSGAVIRDVVVPPERP